MTNCEYYANKRKLEKAYEKAEVLGKDIDSLTDEEWATYCDLLEEIDEREKVNRSGGNLIYCDCDACFRRFESCKF